MTEFRVRYRRIFGAWTDSRNLPAGEADRLAESLRAIGYDAVIRPRRVPPITGGTR
jgi:hypothetical protein